MKTTVDISGRVVSGDVTISVELGDLATAALRRLRDTNRLDAIYIVSAFTGKDGGEAQEFLDEELGA